MTDIYDYQLLTFVVIIAVLLVAIAFLCHHYLHKKEQNKLLVNELDNTIALLTKAGNLISWSLDVKTGKREMIQGEKLLPDNLSDDNYAKYFHPDDAVLLKKLITSIINGERNDVHNTIVRYIKNAEKEEYIYFEVFLTAKKENNKTVKLFCVNRDVTAQALYQQKLEENKTRAELIFLEGKMTQYDYDVVADKYIIYYNDRLFSGKRHELSMDEYVSFSHPEDAKRLTDTISKMKKGIDFSFSTNYRIKSPNDAEWHNMFLTNIPLKKDSNGKVLIYTGLRQDHTQWKQLSTDLEKKNSLLNTVVDRMPCMFFMKDVDKDYSYSLVNSMFCQSMGKTEMEILNHTDYQLFDSKEEADRFRKDDVEAVKQGIKSVQEETLWCGKRTVWHTTKSLFSSSTGERYMIGMSIDITKLDDIFVELRQAKEKAELSDRLKSAFLANMSHEIRTPLNAIVGFTDLLISSEDDIQTKENFGKIISNNSELLLKLINDILDMSKIEAGYIDLKNKPLDIAKIFVEYDNNFRKDIKKNVDFICINPYKSCIIETDKERLLQVVNNFMSNAIKYTPSGSIKLGYECSDNRIKIYVEDTGIGISEENKSRVFQRFEKFDSFAQGNGLGLSICKAIAISMGGEVGFSSTKDKGSVFWISIPCSPIIDNHIDTEEPIAIKKKEKIETNTHKILVAEDNDSNFILLQTILKSYQISRAMNGFEAVEMAKSGNYSIILMDIKMPVMDGLEATRKIREFDSNTPIIALTANAFDSDHDEAISAGCNKYIAKPLKRIELINLINDYLKS